MPFVHLVPLPTDEPAHLFHRYSGESGPQPCHVEIDLTDGRLTCDYNAEIGRNCVPESVYNNRTLRIPIPPLTTAAANALLTDIRGRVQEILDGATVDWDDANTVGRLNDDAADALDRLEKHIAALHPADDDDPTTVIQEFPAEQWRSDNAADAQDLGITADTTDQQLGDIADQLAQTISDNLDASVTVVTGCAQVVTEIRDELRQQTRDQLETIATQYADLRNRRNTLIQRIHAWNAGDSLRGIGALADLTHSGVDKIVRAGNLADELPDPLHNDTALTGQTRKNS